MTFTWIILQQMVAMALLMSPNSWDFWQSQLIALHLVSDLVIALVYFAIPISFIYFVRQRQNSSYYSIFILFSIFIFAFGINHLMAILTLWYPVYWLSEGLKTIPAIISVVTACTIIPLVPKLLKLRNPDKLEKVTRYIVIIIDINGQEKTEKALKESQQMLQLIMNTIPQRVFWKNRNSVFLGCNLQLALDVGLKSPEDIIGKTDYDFSWTLDQAEFYRQVDQEIMETNTPRYRIIETQLQANGKQCWIETNKIPFHDSEGNVVGILGTYEDITERKLAEELLAESETRFRQVGSPGDSS